MNHGIAKTVIATLAAGAILALSAAASASVIVSHNGTGTDPLPAGSGTDPLPAGSGEVDVSLEEGVGLFLHGADSLTSCGTLCITKTWLPGSNDDVHSMVLSFFSEGTDAEEIVFAEIVINATGTPWTDYHIEVTGGFIFLPLVSAALVENGELVPDSALGTDVETGFLPGTDLPISQWVFFDQPFLPFDLDTMTGPVLIFLGSTIPFEFALPGPRDPLATVTVTQHPSFGVPEPASLALFGFGLLGLGAMRRRRRAG